MARKRISYTEGDWFAVPLRTGGYALGIVARKDGDGNILGYFFGPSYDHLPTTTDTLDRRPDQAATIRICGDDGLRTGTWPLIWHHPFWDRQAWPIPRFGRIAVDNSWAEAVECADDDMFAWVRRTPVSVEEARHLPETGVWGYLALEIGLSKLLSSPSNTAV